LPFVAGKISLLTRKRASFIRDAAKNKSNIKYLTASLHPSPYRFDFFSFSNCLKSHVELQIRKFRAKKPKRAKGYLDNPTSFSGFAAEIF